MVGWDYLYFTVIDNELRDVVPWRSSHCQRGTRLPSCHQSLSPNWVLVMAHPHPTNCLQRESQLPSTDLKTPPPEPQVLFHWQCTLHLCTKHPHFLFSCIFSFPFSLVCCAVLSSNALPTELFRRGLCSTFWYDASPILQQQLGVQQFNPVLTLTTWGVSIRCHKLKGSVPQGCPISDPVANVVPRPPTLLPGQLQVH